MNPVIDKHSSHMGSVFLNSRRPCARKTPQEGFAQQMHQVAHMRSELVAMTCRSANPAFTDQEWQLNSLMKETLLTFLTRIAFLLGDAQKDPDAPLLLKHALGLLDDTLALWPNVPVKMTFLNRMLEANLQQSLDPPPALLIGELCDSIFLNRFSLVQPDPPPIPVQLPAVGDYTAVTDSVKQSEWSADREL